MDIEYEQGGGGANLYTIDQGLIMVVSLGPGTVVVCCMEGCRYLCTVDTRTKRIIY